MFKGKAHMSFYSIDLIGNTNVQKGLVKFETSSVGDIHADSSARSKRPF